MNDYEKIHTMIDIHSRPKIYPVLVATTIFFFGIMTILALFGYTPEISEAALKFNIVSPKVDTVPAYVYEPHGISIPKLGINSIILNPIGRDIQTLDRALLEGVVRYPGSGTLGSAGNIVLLGHSSHLAFVQNKAYQAFNDINTLKQGDVINIYGEDKEYRYKVVRVIYAKNSEAVIDLRSTKQKLTLITCNNFGAKEDRYIVEAELITH